MPVFAYQATDSRAHGIQGTIAAESARDARDQLRSQGLLVETVSEQENQSPSGRLQWLKRRGQSGKVTTAVRDLSTLLGAGIGLVDALDTLTAQYRGGFRASLLALRDRVASGSSLSEAMQQDAWLYDELTIEMTKVGEHSGTRVEEQAESAVAGEDSVSGFVLFSGRLTEQTAAELIHAFAQRITVGPHISDTSGWHCVSACLATG